MCGIKDLKGIAITAVAMTILAQIFHTVESILTMGYYLDPAYFQVWSKLMMPVAGPPPASFYIYSIVFALVGWFLFAFAYSKLGAAIKEKTEIRKGLKFGALIFLVAGLPGMLSLYLLINLPAGLIISWMVSSLVLYLAGGIISAKLIRQ